MRSRSESVGSERRLRRLLRLRSGRVVFRHLSSDLLRGDAGERTVPLGAAAITALRRHYLATGRAAEATPVFRDQHGKRVLRNGSTAGGIARVAKAAGLEGVTAHALRHTHITRLVAAGVPNPIAAQRVGQTRLLTQTYAHPGQREDLAALTAVENYRNSGRQAPGC